MWLYAIVAFVMIAIAFVIAKLVRVPDIAAKIELEKQAQEIEGEGQGASADDKQLQEVVCEEVGQYVNSRHKRKEIAKAVSNIIDKTLEERLEKHTEQLRKEYEKKLNEKAKKEEIALKKYKKVLIEKKIQTQLYAV